MSVLGVTSRGWCKRLLQVMSAGDAASDVRPIRVVPSFLAAAPGAVRSRNNRLIMKVSLRVTYM